MFTVNKKEVLYMCNIGFGSKLLFIKYDKSDVQKEILKIDCIVDYMQR